MDRKYLEEMAGALEVPCYVCKKDFVYSFEGRILKDLGICAHETCVVCTYFYFFFCARVPGKKKLIAHYFYKSFFPKVVISKFSLYVFSYNQNCSVSVQPSSGIYLKESRHSTANGDPFERRVNAPNRW